MNIISGIYKHKPLKSPNSALTHPMGSREKLALFNMINCENAAVLDAFAGSGALGLEALSRGAASVTFIEKSPKVTVVLKENIRTVTSNNASATSVFAGPAAKFQTKMHFDLILADPPYDDFHIEDIAHLAVFLAPGGILALSHPRALAPELPGLSLIKTRAYAAASISLFQKA